MTQLFATFLNSNEVDPSLITKHFTANKIVNGVNHFAGVVSRAVGVDLPGIPERYNYLLFLNARDVRIYFDIFIYVFISNYQIYQYKFVKMAL